MLNQEGRPNLTVARGAAHFSQRMTKLKSPSSSLLCHPSHSAFSPLLRVPRQPYHLRHCGRGPGWKKQVQGGGWLHLPRLSRPVGAAYTLLVRTVSHGISPYKASWEMFHILLPCCNVSEIEVCCITSVLLWGCWRVFSRFFNTENFECTKNRENRI